MYTVPLSVGVCALVAIGDGSGWGYDLFFVPWRLMARLRLQRRGALLLCVGGQCQSGGSTSRTESIDERAMGTVNRGPRVLGVL